MKRSGSRGAGGSTRRTTALLLMRTCRDRRARRTRAGAGWIWRGRRQRAGACPLRTRGRSSSRCEVNATTAPSVTSARRPPRRQRGPDDECQLSSSRCDEYATTSAPSTRPLRRNRLCKLYFVVTKQGARGRIQRGKIQVRARPSAGGRSARTAPTAARTPRPGPAPNSRRAS